jgi:hypothetical protein
MRHIGIIASNISKSNRPAPTRIFSSNTPNGSVNVSTLSGYIAGQSDIIITVNPAVWVYSTTAGTAGLTISGGTTGDTIRIENKGYIAGLGGNGGYYSTAPTNGGSAIKLNLTAPQPTVTINNASTGFIGGGGGGGAGTGGCGGGGGAGGGNGGGYTGTSGLGGQPGFVGNGPASDSSIGSGGGRLFTIPLTGGTGSRQTSSTITLASDSQCGGGGGTYYPGGGYNAQAGGGGGGWGAAGGSSISASDPITFPLTAGNGGGGTGGGNATISGSGASTSYTGGLAGKAVDRNGFTCTVLGANIYGSTT